MLWIVCCLVLNFEIFMCEKNITITLPLGRIIGNVKQTRRGEEIFTFRGIRYAEPPIGTRRFSDPIPIQPWIKVMDARNIGWMCPQSDLSSHLEYSEDCLNLDVYTRNFSSKFPVLVYIHGGTFEFGGRFHAQPQYLLDKEVVLVSINYRLGSLGFFSTATQEATGNYGLKDQVLALKWVKNYIQYFGGDPQSITLIGHSVGGMSITLHLLSPMSQGLFHKVIIMSGAITLPGKTNIFELSKNFTKTLNCSNGDVVSEIECLRNVPVEEIVKENIVVRRKYPGLTWTYEIESDFGQEIFINKDPNELYVESNFQKLPIIVGMTKDEVSYVANAFKNSESLNILDENFNEIAPYAFQYQMKSSHSENTTKILREFYFNDQKLNMQNIDELGKLFADSLIFFGIHRFVNFIRKYTNLFFYRFDYIGRFGHDYDSNGKPKGVLHCDDLQYIFVNEKLAPIFNETDRENIMVERLTHWFTTFAATVLTIFSFEKLGNMYGVLLVCCIFINLINFSYELNEPKVKIGKVTYIGNYLKTWNSENIVAFRGIRFAQPPIGDLRFKDPKPIHYNFSIEYDATKFGSECPSTYAVNPSEDCLFLNIFAKNISENISISPLKPVIIFIHPGGFYIESSSRYGPEYLLTKDIILVTLNYRLGTLGFLNIGTKDIPGNAGLKDQVIAFRWVQQNIADFGGNPQDITIMGYSAGGLSVCLHLVSPMSQGLFQRAIIMSGTLPPQMKIKNEQKYLAIRQAKVMGCDINFDDKNQILECLNKFSGNEIALTLRSMFDFGYDNPIYLWEPVLEKDYGQERFLIEDPYKSFKNGDFAKVPILIGFTNNEFCNSAGDILHNKFLLDDFNENFKKLAPICFNYNDLNKENMNLITEKLKNYYFSNEKVTMEKFSNLCELFSDSIIRFGAYRLAEIISQYNVPVYTYKFSYAGRFTTLNFTGGPKGAEHMDDMLYLFPTETVKFNVTDPEAQIVNTMVELITFFAQNSKPLDNEEQKLDFVSNRYIEIQDKLEIKQGRNFDNTEIWNELFPL